MSMMEQHGHTEPNGAGVGGTPGDGGEAASWAALEAELGDDAEHQDAGEPSGAGESGAEAAADDPGASADDAADQDGAEKKPDADQLVRQYQAAMREEREQRKALQAQLNEIQEAIRQAREQRQQPEQAEQPPSIDDDPVAYFEWKSAQLEKQVEETKQLAEQQREQFQQGQQHQQFMHRLEAGEAQFSAQAPDYYEAADHLKSVRLSQLEAIYPSTPQVDAYAQQQGFQSAEQMRQAHLMQEVQMYANQAMQTGRNPAEVFYALAKSAGWQGKPQAQAPTPQRKAEVARAGARRAQSLSGGGGTGGSPDNATAAELADLYMTDPEAADKLFDKLAANGSLG